jgi:TRAP-type C4-dicarboxylate transport system permease small subunit
MSQPDLPLEMQPLKMQPVEGQRTARERTAMLERLTGWLAGIGGLLTLAVALVATASVTLRWLFSSPIDGDFEYVKMATACAVFAYLPYTQARRGNIMVDTFTSWLPARFNRVIDAFWDIVFAAIMAYLTYALVFGTRDAWRSGETTMQKQIVLWPSLALCTLFAALLVVTCLLTAFRLVRQGSDRSRA